jgi:hypothetical protein
MVKPLGVAALAVLLPAGVLAQSAPAVGPTGVRIDAGIEERYRLESFDNLSDFRTGIDDARTQHRFRTRAWASMTIGRGLDVQASLANESRKTTSPSTPFGWDETVIDTLALGVSAGAHWSFRAGRQNLTRGDGFVIADGSPLDGSRTYYLNAVDAAWASKTSRVEVLAISDPHHDRYLPVFHEAAAPKPLIEWNETAVGVYATRAQTHGSLDGYVFRKCESGDPRASGSRLYQPDRRITLAGGRLVRTWPHGWSVTGELAAEWGRQSADGAGGVPARAIRAWGGHGRVKRTFAAFMGPSIAIGWIAASGDDPATPRLEGWDPMFARWPRYGEVMPVSYASEVGPAYFTNTRMWEVEAHLTPRRDVDVRASYYRIGAFHPVTGEPSLFGQGTQRGGVWQAKAEWSASPHWKSHVLYEHYGPGTFFAGRDSAHFIRLEASYIIAGSRTFAR